MPIETEIKFRLTDLAALAGRLQSAGFRLETPRSFESNVLYDTPDRQLRARTEILRIRSYAGRWTLTHKRLPDVPALAKTRHKHRIETETGIANGDALAEFFLPWPRLRLPLREMAHGVDRWRGPLRFDETPIGDYAELEGPPRGSTAPQPGSASIPPNTSLSATGVSSRPGARTFQLSQ